MKCHLWKLECCRRRIKRNKMSRVQKKEREENKRIERIERINDQIIRFYNIRQRGDRMAWITQSVESNTISHKTKIAIKFLHNKTTGYDFAILFIFKPFYMVSFTNIHKHTHHTESKEDRNAYLKLTPKCMTLGTSTVIKRYMCVGNEKFKVIGFVRC